MKPRLIRCVVLGLTLMAGSAFAQTYPPPSAYPSNPPNGAVQPNQPVQPQPPVLIRRPLPPPAQSGPAVGQPAAAPFTLTPEQEAEVDRVLRLWEEHNSKIKRFDCQFKRWTYDAVFGKPGEAKFVDVGVIKYGAPDRGLFRAVSTEKDGKLVPIEDARAEHWLSDGKAIYEYDHVKKQVIEHRLPPELQGKAIANTPLPFLFGAEAQRLKQRYFIRCVAAPGNIQGQACLEAYPRFQQDAANFHHAQFMINTRDMSPHALRLVDTNGKDSRVFQFFDIAVDPVTLFQQDPFRPSTPSGWQKVLGKVTPPQARRVPSVRPMIR